MKINVVLSNGTKDLWDEVGVHYKISGDNVLTIYIHSFVRAIYNPAGWLVVGFVT